MFVKASIRKCMFIKRKKNGLKKLKQTKRKPMDLLVAKIHFHYVGCFSCY